MKQRPWLGDVHNLDSANRSFISVGAHFTYASWYRRSELGKRAAVFCGFGNIGNMAGGWIQAGLLGSLSGKTGLPAWRWIFIVVSVTTIPIAIFGEREAYKVNLGEQP